MADLHALIRLNKHELDERRRVLTALNVEMMVLQNQRQALEDAFAAEKAAVDQLEEAAFTFANYVQAVNKRREEIDEAARILAEQIEKAKEAVMETFGEIKKFEMAQAERDRIEADKRKAKEDQMMDDIGLETFRRKEDEE